VTPVSARSAAMMAVADSFQRDACLPIRLMLTQCAVEFFRHE